jgi:hypothetical protein
MHNVHTDTGGIMTQETIPMIPLSRGFKIADYPEETGNKGQFVCTHFSGGQHCFEAIHNSEEFRTRVFYSYEEATAWLRTFES